MGLKFPDYVFFTGAILSLSIPALAFLAFGFGIALNYQTLNVYLNALFLCVFILFIVIKMRIFKYSYFFLLIGVVFVLNYISYNFPVFDKRPLPEFIGLYVGLFFAPLSSIAIVLHGGTNDSLRIYLNFFFKAGVLISLINILFFIALYTRNYSTIYAYTGFIGLGNYVLDMGSYFVRPAGYFFDYHSQYYTPLFALVIVLNDDLNLSRRIKFLTILLIVVSIGLSGIKSAYLSLLGVLLLYLTLKSSILQRLLSLGWLIILLIVINLFTSNLIYELAYKIVVHDVNILIEHILEVPLYLWSSLQYVFLLGGQVGMEAHVYSEVYYVTLLYYIGFIGLLFIVLIPLILLFLRGRTFLHKGIALIMALSLLHYYVYKVSFNIYSTALVYAYFVQYILGHRKRYNGVS